jgi:hypothetical protein
MKAKPEMVLFFEKKQQQQTNKQKQNKIKNSNLEIWANIPPDFSNPLLSSLLFLRHTVEPQ